MSVEVWYLHKYYLEVGKMIFPKLIQIRSILYYVIITSIERLKMMNMTAAKRFAIPSNNRYIKNFTRKFKFG